MHVFHILLLCYLLSAICFCFALGVFWCSVLHNALRFPLPCFVGATSNIETVHLPHCIICGQNDDMNNLHVLTERGKSTILNACQVHGIEDLMQYVVACDSEMLVHNACRKSFTDTRKLKRAKTDDEELNTHLLRSEESL